MVLEGELTLALAAGESRALARGAVVRVGPGVRRQLVNEGPVRLVLLALGAAGEHRGRDAEAWSAWDQEGPGRSPQEVPLPADLPPDGGGPA